MGLLGGSHITAHVKLNKAPLDDKENTVPCGARPTTHPVSECWVSAVQPQVV